MSGQARVEKSEIECPGHVWRRVKLRVCVSGQPGHVWRGVKLSECVCVWPARTCVEGSEIECVCGQPGHVWRGVKLSVCVWPARTCVEGTRTCVEGSEIECVCVCVCGQPGHVWRRVKLSVCVASQDIYAWKGRCSSDGDGDGGGDGDGQCACSAEAEGWGAGTVRRRTPGLAAPLVLQHDGLAHPKKVPQHNGRGTGGAHALGACKCQLACVQTPVRCWPQGACCKALTAGRRLPASALDPASNQTKTGNTLARHPGTGMSSSVAKSYSCSRVREHEYTCATRVYSFLTYKHVAPSKHIHT
eukprot:356398-Chlamydomonas_euryale.AAC.2